MDITKYVREFILRRAGEGRFHISYLKKYFTCFVRQDVSDDELIEALKRFKMPGINIKLDGEYFEVVVDSPISLLRSIIERNSGKKLRTIMDEFSKIFGDFDQERFRKILSSIDDVMLICDGKTVSPREKFDPECIIGLFY